MAQGLMGGPRKSFPSTPEEAGTAKRNMVQAIHSEKVQPRIVKALQEQNMQKIAELVGMLVYRLVSSAREKVGGKVHIRLVTSLIHAAVGEINIIAKQLKLKPIDRGIMREIEQMAGNVVEQLTIQGGQGKQQGMQPGMQQGPPQGMPPGGMQPKGLLEV